MRIAFFGTPEAAVPSLRALVGSPHRVVAVVTQPDRARGRGRAVTPSPVKELALQRGLPVLQPESPTQDGFAAALRGCEPQALAVVAYGHLLPRDVLEATPALNVHFSILPVYRGAAPVQRALIDGRNETGVSVFLLEPTLDTGPVVARERIAVSSEETAGEVIARLAPIGAALLVRALDALADGTLTPEPQDHAAASPAPKIASHEAVGDWAGPASGIANLGRALIIRARPITAG
jgi:methionyl-tRNA formyltransferase